MKLTFDQAREVANMLYARADADMKRAAGMDEFQDQGKSYTAASREWAKASQAQVREDAATLRAFGRFLLVEASNRD